MRILVCSVDHPGTRTQAVGVAAAVREGWLARHPGQRVQVDIYRWWHPLAGRLGLYRPGLIVSCAASGERRARRQKALTPGALWCHVELADPAQARPDLNVVPLHDWRPEFDGRPDMLAVPGVPHEVTPAIRKGREAARRRLGLDPKARVAALLIGGPNPAFRYDAETCGRIRALAEGIVAAGFACLVTGSRRTPETLTASLRQGQSQDPGLRLWDGTGANPYRDYLAAADLFFVTEDSISMTCETLATGQPVHVVPLAAVPGERLDKFRRFQAGFGDLLRPLDGWQGEAVPGAAAAAVPLAARLAADRLLDLSAGPRG